MHTLVTFDEMCKFQEDMHAKTLAIVKIMNDSCIINNEILELCLSIDDTMTKFLLHLIDNSATKLKYSEIT